MAGFDVGSFQATTKTLQLNMKTHNQHTHTQAASRSGSLGWPSWAATPVGLITLISLAGCAGPGSVVQLQPVGPVPNSVASASAEGCLQVYTARERAPVDANATEFFWNGDFGQNQFLHGMAHSPYTVCTVEGKVLRRVPNTTGMNDPQPTRLTLAPGDYQVRAEAERYNDVTIPVVVPVRIEGGKTTVVHLDGRWESQPPPAPEKSVRLPDGQIVGWKFASRSDEASR